jgi:transcriptional regulator with XRE-family HTH domain
LSSQAHQARAVLGARLREIRVEAGLTGRALAALAGWHYTKISKLEHAATSPSEEDIRAWCHHCNAGDQVPDLIASVRTIESMYREWRRQMRAGLKRLQASSIPLYERTTLFRVYEHTVFPGLFHTADYARALLSYWPDVLPIPNDVDAAVATRLERQNVLHQGRKRFVFLLAEQVLRTRVGSAEVMVGQLDKTLDALSLPKVSVGIIPAGAERYAWSQVAFWIFDDQQVNVDTVSAGLEITQPREIALYVRTFDQLKQSAVFGDEARSLIGGVRAELAPGAAELSSGAS